VAPVRAEGERVMADPTQPGTELATYDDEIGIGPAQPHADHRTDQRTPVDLMQKTIAVGEGDQVITRAELGHFLELCALYGLDPFAREAWIAKSKSGKLLIMVGRAGLRKVADRNGLRVRTDVICAKDEFESEFIDSPADAKEGEWQAHGGQPFHRVTHRKRGIGTQARGAVAGAWSRVTMRATGVEVGYFDAPISEYKPVNASTYSPWSKQESAMMQGAVERQAIAQGTPLGGLMAQGEDESVDRATIGSAGQGDGSMPEWTIDTAQRVKAEAIIERAKALGHHGYSEESVRMALNGQTFSVIEQRLAQMDATLDQFRGQDAEPITDADVVPDAPAADEFTLSFGGETFSFPESGETYAMIAEAMADGPDAMEATARALRTAGESHDDEDEGLRYIDMAVALHAEAQERADGS
jgi:hypothetical protein